MPECLSKRHCSSAIAIPRLERLIVLLSAHWSKSPAETPQRIGPRSLPLAVPLGVEFPLVVGVALALVAGVELPLVGVVSVVVPEAGLLAASPVLVVPPTGAFEAVGALCVTSCANDWNAFANAVNASGLRAWIKLASESNA